MYRGSQKGGDIEQWLSFKKEGKVQKRGIRGEILDMKEILEFVIMEAEKGAVISSLHRDMENLVPVTLKEQG